MAKATTKAATPRKTTRKAAGKAAAPGQKIKLAQLSSPPDEMFVDGVSGMMSRAGIVKIDLFRVTGYERKEKAEVHTITQRLVMPVSSLPELLRLAQDLVKAHAAKS